MHTAIKNNTSETNNNHRAFTITNQEKKQALNNK